MFCKYDYFVITERYENQQNDLLVGRRHFDIGYLLNPNIGFYDGGCFVSKNSIYNK